jgi:hypothetical protein
VNGEHQLSLFAEPTEVRLTKVQAGLRSGQPPGPQRLLSELVKRGLRREHLPAAARLCLLLAEARRPQ